MNRHGFLEEVEKRFNDLFRTSKRGNIPPAEQRHKLEGFVEAGIFLGLVRSEEVDALIEQIHLSVFGMTMEEHRLHHATSWSQSKIDYSPYDEPTFERLSSNKPSDPAFGNN